MNCNWVSVSYEKMPTCWNVPRGNGIIGINIWESLECLQNCVHQGILIFKNWKKGDCLTLFLRTVLITYTNAHTFFTLILSLQYTTTWFIRCYKRCSFQHYIDGLGSLYHSVNIVPLHMDLPLFKG